MPGRSRVRVKRWQVVLYMEAVLLVDFVFRGAPGRGRALMLVAVAALIGMATFHAMAAAYGKRRGRHAIGAVIAVLLVAWIPQAWTQHERAAAGARYVESIRRDLRQRCPHDQEAKAQEILTRWAEAGAPTTIDCASGGSVGAYGNGDRPGEIRSTAVCADVQTSNYYDGGDGSAGLVVLSCRSRLSRTA
jgi:hypothetical protein